MLPSADRGPHHSGFAVTAAPLHKRQNQLVTDYSEAKLSVSQDYPTVCLTNLTKNSLYDREPNIMMSTFQIHTINVEETL